MTEVLTYEALKAERDALEIRLRNALISEQEAIQRAHAANQTADALAVENAALKVAVDGFNQELYGKGFEVLGWHLNGDTEPLDNWFGENDWNPETPATDAALAAIRLEAKIEGANELAERIAEMHSKTAPGSNIEKKLKFAAEAANIEKKLMFAAEAAIAYDNGLREAK